MRGRPCCVGDQGDCGTCDGLPSDASRAHTCLVRMVVLYLDLMVFLAAASTVSSSALQAGG